MACGSKAQRKQVVCSCHSDAGMPARAQGWCSLLLFRPFWIRKAAGDSCQGMEIRQPQEGRVEARDKEGLMVTEIQVLVTVCLRYHQ